MKIRLTITDPKLKKDEMVQAWLKEAEKTINEKFETLDILAHGDWAFFIRDN